MGKYRCGIFDLDGTLLNTLLDLTDAVNTTMAKFGYPARTQDEVRSFLGNGGQNLIMKCTGVFDAEKIADVYRFYNAYYGENYKRLTRAYDGISEALTVLQNAGIKLAVLSNKGHAMTVPLIEKCLPDIHFEAVFGQRPNVALKPEAGAVYEILDLLNVTPEETLYFGDSDIDIKTAKNAKVDMVTVTWGYRFRDTLTAAGADWFIDRPDEIPGTFGL